MCGCSCLCLRTQLLWHNQKSLISLTHCSLSLFYFATPLQLTPSTEESWCFCTCILMHNVVLHSPNWLAMTGLATNDGQEKNVQMNHSLIGQTNCTKLNWKCELWMKTMLKKQWRKGKEPKHLRTASWTHWRESRKPTCSLHTAKKPTGTCYRVCSSFYNLLLMSRSGACPMTWSRWAMG